MELTIFADGVDINAVSSESVQVTLEGVDISQVIEEVGSDTILAEMDLEEIYDYIREQEDEDAENE